MKTSSHSQIDAQQDRAVSNRKERRGRAALELVGSANAARTSSLPRPVAGPMVLSWPVVLVASSLCALRLTGLTHQSLWYDEGYTLSLASSTSLSQFLKTFAGYTTSEHLQPLYYFFMFLWSRVAGTSDFALRLPSALFSIASVAVVYAFCRDLSRIRRSLALTACAALGFSSFSIYYAQEARPYALLQLLSLSMLAIWVRGKYLPTNSDSTAARVLFVLACGLCTLGSIFTAALVFSLALADLGADLLSKRITTAWLRTWTVPLAVSAGSAALYLWFAHRSFPYLVSKDVISRKQPLWMNVGYTLYGILFGTTVGPASEQLRGASRLHVLLQFWPVILLSVMLAGAFMVGAVHLLQPNSRINPAARTLAWATGLYTVLLFVVFGYIGHLNILPRHASGLFSLLFFLVVLCGFAERTTNRARGGFWLTAAAAGWFAMNLFSIYGYRFTPAFQKDDYRAAAQILAASSRIPTFMVAGQPVLMQHYGTPVIDATGVELQDLGKFLRARSNAASRINVVMNDYRGYRWDYSSGPIQVLAPDYNCLVQRRLAYIDLIVCELNPAPTGGVGSPPAAEAAARRARDL